jgi:hypothetical protein
MVNLMVEGGVPMWFLLAFGVATLVAAARFAWRPVGRSPAPVWCLAIGTTAWIATAVMQDLAAVGHHGPDYLRAHPDVSLAHMLMQGLAESMAPGILGFVILSLSSLLIAVGLYRRPADL